MATCAICFHHDHGGVMWDVCLEKSFGWLLFDRFIQTERPNKNAVRIHKLIILFDALPQLLLWLPLRKENHSFLLVIATQAPEESRRKETRHDGAFYGSQQDDRQKADQCYSIWVSPFDFIEVRLYLKLIKTISLTHRLILHWFVCLKFPFLNLSWLFFSIPFRKTVSIPMPTHGLGVLLRLRLTWP